MVRHMSFFAAGSEISRGGGCCIRYFVSGLVVCYALMSWNPDKDGGCCFFVDSMPKGYLKVTLASASTFSGSVVRASMGGERLPKMSCLVAGAWGHGERSSPS